MVLTMLRPRAEPETSRSACPSCAPGLPLCVACYLDRLELGRLEDEHVDTLEGYRERV